MFEADCSHTDHVRDTSRLEAERSEPDRCALWMYKRRKNSKDSTGCATFLPLVEACDLCFCGGVKPACLVQCLCKAASAWLVSRSLKRRATTTERVIVIPAHSLKARRAAAVLPWSLLRFERFQTLSITSSSTIFLPRSAIKPDRVSSTSRWRGGRKTNKVSGDSPDRCVQKPLGWNALKNPAATVSTELLEEMSEILSLFVS